MTAKHQCVSEYELVTYDKQWQTLAVSNRVLTCETKYHIPQRARRPYQSPATPPCLGAMPTVETNDTTLTVSSWTQCLSFATVLAPLAFFPRFLIISQCERIPD